MRPGTVVELPDGRRATVVYHGLDGYGIQWGELEVDVEAILKGSPTFGEWAGDWEYDPDAMLRESYPGAVTECVGGDYVIVEETEDG